MSELAFYPQKIFAPAYYTDPNEILKRRTIFREEYDFFVDYGGRGGGKTQDKVEAVVVEASLRRVRVLVGRELQNSIEESVKAEIEEKIAELGLGWFFKITDKQIVGRNGSKFIFKGIKNNINNIKSIANVDIVLLEEAENISKKSWEKLLPSIRPKSGRPIVIVIFNPDDELDDTYQRWIVDTPDKTLITNCNYYDNKYFPKHLEEQRKHAKKTLPLRDYEHIWLGKPKGPGGNIIIDPEWVKAARFASDNPDWVKVGKKVVGYDPAGQGRDCHAVTYIDGNQLEEIDEWPLSPDLRVGTRRSLAMVRKHNADLYRYDECGGFGDGVAVFVNDNITGKDEDEEGKLIPSINVEVVPFNAGDSPVNADKEIEGTEKTWGETYTNAKAQAHAVFAQLLYNTYRFIVLGERDINPEDMLSINLSDDAEFNKLRKELTTPIWVKSEVNSKKKVESKDAMEKRTGQPSPNIADSSIMCKAPLERKSSAIGLMIPKRLR